MFRKILNYTLKNKITVGIAAIYALTIISVIGWGIPSQNHPFTYNMDEWHQFQSIRTTFRNLSANVPGSAHGTMFHFILSGLYLIPFCLFKIIDPFILKSSVDQLEMQRRIFEILRLNTLIFGLLSIFTIAKLAKDYLKVNSSIVVILFTITPLWLSLSNYYKYDVALTFWIILSLLFLLKFGAKPTLKNYLIAGVCCSLSVATKISALPIFLAYLISYFWFNKKNRWKLNELSLGILVFFVIFIFLGIPDLLLGKGDWREFLYSNLISGSSGYSNVLTGFSNWWQYLLLKILPIDFGYGFILIYAIGIIYWLVLLIHSIFRKKLFLFKNEFFLLFCFLLFSFSLIPLKLGANGNRLLVLLPFFAIFSSLFVLKALKSFPLLKIQMSAILILIFVIQFCQSFAMIYIKWQADPRELSSSWIKKNINRGNTIGIENVPIYQILPDIVIKEFYSEKENNIFKYDIVKAESVFLPDTVIVANKELDLNFLKKSFKKDLLIRLDKEGYRIIGEFKPSLILYKIMDNEFVFQTSGIVPTSTITIYKQDNNPQN